MLLTHLERGFLHATQVQREVTKDVGGRKMKQKRSLCHSVYWSVHRKSKTKHNKQFRTG